MIYYFMGIDIVDINNDGFIDIILVDMFLEDLKIYKILGIEFNY